MRSSKSRSRSKSNRQRSPMGNIVNRVFDSSGPEGKVRGTPQQIIDKYLALARDAQLGNDRVAAENFLQHAEHYARMLGEAQREQEAMRQSTGGGDQQMRGDGQEDDRREDRREDRRDDRREERRDDRAEERRDVGRDVGRDGGRDGGRDEQREVRSGGDGGPRSGQRDRRPRDERRPPAGGDVIDFGGDEGSRLVDTPEARARDEGRAELHEFGTPAPAETRSGPAPEDDGRGAGRSRRGRRPKAAEGAADDAASEAAE